MVGEPCLVSPQGTHTPMPLHEIESYLDWLEATGTLSLLPETSLDRGFA